MRWSVCFLVLISMCFPADLQVEDYTKAYQSNVNDTLELTSKQSLSITTSFGSDEQLTFAPSELFHIKTSVSKVSLITILEHDTYEVNAVFPMLLLNATCYRSNAEPTECTATIMSFNFSATYKDENDPAPPTFVEGRVEMPESIEVEASIAYQPNPWNEQETEKQAKTAESNVARQIKEAITKNGPPGALLMAIQDALDESFIQAIFS